jgi:hypothetical protein
MMDLDIQLTASAIVNFVDRCADMESAQIVDKQSGTSMEKSRVATFLQAVTGTANLYTYTFGLDSGVDTEFAVKLFIELKARFGEEAHAMHFSTGCLMGKSSKPGYGETTINMALER